MRSLALVALLAVAPAYADPSPPITLPDPTMGEGNGMTSIAHATAAKRSGTVKLAITGGTLVYQRVMLKVDGADLRVTRVVVTFDDGKRTTVKLGKIGKRPLIMLPGEDGHSVTAVRVTYDHHGKTPAELTVQGYQAVD
jgi:hypothetical protein